MYLILLEGEEGTGGWGNLLIEKLTYTVRWNVIMISKSGRRKAGSVARIGEFNRKCKQIFQSETVDEKYNFADLRCREG
jgi:hypothetical protein